jgi:pimeloyl-ACP methyl ester carboxylesterase
MVMSHVIYGYGPVRAILLHGWFGDAHCFQPMLQGFDPERFCFASMDFRGYGSAKSSEGPFDLTTVASDAITLADGLGWDRFAVVGHSMGGKAALLTAARAAQRVTRLCGITPVWAAPAPFDAETVSFFRTAAEQASVRQAIIHNTAGGRLTPYWSGSVAARSMQTSLPRAFANYFDSWALSDFQDQVKRITAEILVVVGAHDQGIPEPFVRETWLRSLPNARLSVMPESGHYPMDECPLMLAAILSEFLDPPH